MFHDNRDILLSSDDGIDSSGIDWGGVISDATYTDGKFALYGKRGVFNTDATIQDRTTVRLATILHFESPLRKQNLFSLDGYDLGYNLYKFDWVDQVASDYSGFGPTYRLVISFAISDFANTIRLASGQGPGAGTVSLSTIRNSLPDCFKNGDGWQIYYGLAGNYITLYENNESGGGIIAESHFTTVETVFNSVADNGWSNISDDADIYGICIAISPLDTSSDSASGGKHNWTNIVTYPALYTPIGDPEAVADATVLANIQQAMTITDLTAYTTGE